MSINNIIPTENDILKDDSQLWYFTKEQKNTIINYLETCTLDDLKDVSCMSNIYYIPTWYYFLNDYDITKKLTQKEQFKDLLKLRENDYKFPEVKEDQEIDMMSSFKKVVTHLDTTVYFTPNNEILLLLKNAGFTFKDNSFAQENYYRTYEIIKSGIIDFNEDYLIQNIYTIGNNPTSIIQKILFNYESKKESRHDMLNMAKAINGFVELGCTTEIQYKKLITASEYFISEKKHYKELIKEHCPELHIFMEKLDFINKMQVLGTKKQARAKI